MLQICNLIPLNLFNKQPNKQTKNIFYSAITVTHTENWEQLYLLEL